MSLSSSLPPLFDNSHFSLVESLELDSKIMLVLQEDTIVPKKIEYSPGLCRIFKEIVTNATDNKHRHPNTMDKVDIEIYPDTGFISVKNNGKGIPIEWHKDEYCYIPTFLFSKMHSSSDFHLLGGRNGNGAKLANIFSTEFKVECGDTSQNKTFFRPSVTR